MRLHLLLPFLLAGCSRDGGAPAERPDIVLLLVNGLRADPAGENDAEYAVIQAMNRTPVARFRAAYTQSVSPDLALGSLLTGLHVSAIPLCGLPRLQSLEEPPSCSRLPPDTATLPAILGYYGYRTGSFSADLGRTARLLGDFGVVSEWPRDPNRSIPWQALASAAKQWWEEDSTHPRFMVVSILMDDVHLQNAMAEARTSLGFDETERKAWLARQNPELAHRVSSLPYWPITSERGTRHIRSAYTELGTAIGRDVGTFLDELQASGQTPGRPQWTLLTSLFGANLGESTGTLSPEQGQPGDRLILLDRTIHVPLVLWGPQPTFFTRQPDHPVQLTDVLPTLLTLGQAVPPARISGSDLLPQVSNGPEDAWAYAEFGDTLALRHERLLTTFRLTRHGMSSLSPGLTADLLMRRPSNDPCLSFFSNNFTLYDVVSDPMQEHDLSQDLPCELSAERDLLIHVRTEVATPPPAFYDDAKILSILGTRAMEYW